MRTVESRSVTTAQPAAAIPIAKGSGAGLPTDDLFFRQWYLNNTGQSHGTPGVDLNVLGVWKDYTGEGVTVGVYDDGVQYDHPDLDGNYDRRLHVVIDGQKHDPYPEHADATHGTHVAGVIAAERDGVGTVGVAYGATIVGVDIFFDPLIGELEFEPSWVAAFAAMRQFDVVNHSWQFTPYFDNLFSASSGVQAFHAAWAESAEFGRGGLGTVNVVAAGNDRMFHLDSNISNTTSSPYSIAVAAVHHDGAVTLYSSPGASVLVSGLSSMAEGPLEADVWTTDLTGPGGYSDGSNEAPLNDRADYTAYFGGTSSAAPTVSGVVALMLEANPLLGYRDVQEILAYTARHVGSEIGRKPQGYELFRWGFNAAQDWNGGGLHFSNDYGFGLVDALAAVRLAESWTGQATFANLQRVTTDYWHGDLAIPDSKKAGVSFTIAADATVDIEHVALAINQSGALSDYEITLTSPSGTTSIVAHPTPFVIFTDPTSLKGWTYHSNAFRGEEAAGVWTVTITDMLAEDEGRVTDAYLRFFGAAPTEDDVLIFTNEFSDFAGRKGHSKAIGDNKGHDTINAAAVTAATTIDLGTGKGSIDGVGITIRKSVRDVFGGDGDDRLTGDERANLLSGGRGDDVLKGEGGKDVLEDGSGRDMLYGGAKADLFRLVRDHDIDSIADFETGRDRLELCAPDGVDMEDVVLRTLAKNMVEVCYLDERLIVAGTSLTAAALLDDILIA